MFIKKIIPILIFIAIVARFIGLDYIPPHLSNDEIGASYAAYSISKTMKDGANHFLPLLWTSNGGTGSPLAIYVPLLSIVVLGNNDFAVRLPAAILGSLTVILIGLLVMEITKNYNLAIITSFILAYSPWHFSASRWALESNYALFFIVLGLYLFFLWINKQKNWAVVLSFISFALSIYSYYTEWILTPLIILVLLILYRKTILRRKIYLIAIILFGLLVVPLFFDFLNNINSSRASSEFIGRDINVSRTLLLYKNPIVKGQILLKAVLDKFSAYNSLDYLFFYGARLLPKENPYQFGFFLTPFVVAFVWGIYRLKYLYKEHYKFVFILLGISPLAASMTLGDINNWRSLPQLLPVSMVTAVGVVSILDYLKNIYWVKLLGCVLIAVSLLYFSLIYCFHFRIENAQGYQYGYKQMANYIKDNYMNFKKIIIDQRFGSKDYYYIGVPSSYIPFYTYLDPKEVQSAKIIPFGITFDKYEFRNINWDNEIIQKDYLYVVPGDIVPDTGDNLKQLYEVVLPDNKVQFRFYSE